MSTICVIPARGGSQRIPGKNIKYFCGKPMIAWALDVARRSELFDRVIVSTDDTNIAKVAESYGGEVPFRRPAELCEDHVATFDVVLHTIEWLKSRGQSVEAVCCLYATAPFVTINALRKGGEAISKPNTAMAFAATTFPYPVQRAFRLDDDRRPVMLQPEHYLTQSQDFDEAFHDAGQFLWGTCKAWLTRMNPFGPQSDIVQLPRHRVQDIDTPEDWKRAEMLMRILEDEGRE